MCLYARYESCLYLGEFNKLYFTKYQYKCCKLLSEWLDYEIKCLYNCVVIKMLKINIYNVQSAKKDSLSNQVWKWQFTNLWYITRLYWMHL